jgi:hypothetical protein
MESYNYKYLTGGLYSLTGFRVVSSPLVVFTDRVQFKFPRSKKRRIRKKWAKRAINFKDVKRGGTVIVNGIMYCHPSIFHEIQKNIMDQEEKKLFVQFCGKEKNS